MVLPISVSLNDSLADCLLSFLELQLESDEDSVNLKLKLTEIGKSLVNHASRKFSDLRASPRNS